MISALDADCVLLPIDMQVGFDLPSWPPRNNPDQDAHALGLMAGWRAAGRPIIHVQHDSVEPGSTLAPGTKGHAFRPGFAPQNGEPLVNKSVNSAFIGTDLDLRLRRMGITTIVTFGISTDMCVSTTVRMGANLGYRMLVVGDACACFALPDGHGEIVPAELVQRVHLATLGFEFATIVSVDQVLAAV